MTRLFLAGSLLIASAIAQERADKQPGKPTAEARMKELQEMQKKCIDDYRAAIKAAQEAAKNVKPGEAMPAMPMSPDYGPILEKAMAAAAEFAGTDDAVQFLVMVLQSSRDQSMARHALDVLLTGHLDSDGFAAIAGLAPYLPQLVGEDAVGPALEKMAKSHNGKVRGWAVYAKNLPTIEKAEREGEAYAEAKAALLKIADECGDKRLAKEIRSAIDLREKFGAGNTAPDIAGVDLDGVAFKMSDYQGKVIFLDFWGDW